MRARDLFGVGLRLVGVWFLTQSAYRAFWAIWKTAGGEGNPRVTVGNDVAEFLIDIVIATVLLLLADHIVLAIYGRPITTLPPTDDTASPSPDA